MPKGNVQRIEYDPYLELEFPKVEAWTPAEHYRILHRRDNFAKHRAARVHLSRMLKTSNDFKSHNADMMEVYDRRYETWKFFGCRGKRPSEPTPLKYKNEEQLVTINNIVSDAFFLETYLDSLAGQKDFYMSQNTFIFHRREENWLSLGALYLDYDNPMENYGLEPQQLAVELISLCDAEGIPRPSYIMSSGIGLNLVWLHSYRYRPKNREKIGALSRWKAVEAELHRRFAKNGKKPDSAVKDVTRIFRIAGTVNSKNGATVQR